MAGADPNATDMDGVTPLHRAVRTRSAPAVQALLEGGANPTRRNKRGSTPMQVATKMTGRSGSGTERAREQQAQIIRLLIAHGAEGRTNH
jgi:Ankyrin repeats (many copies)